MKSETFSEDPVVNFKTECENGEAVPDFLKCETRLLAGGWKMNAVDPPEDDATTTKETSFTERLNERATKRTRLLEGILNMRIPHSHWGINE